MPADVPPTGEPSEPASAPDLRASDADRDRVIDVLRAATADGRLTADEFSERMEAALASRTFRELAPLTADLAAAPAQPKPENAQAEDVLRIDQRGGSVRRTGRCVVAHEAPVYAGLGAEVAARVTEQCFYHLEAPVLRVGGFATPYPPSRIEEHYLPDLDRILDAVDRAFGY